MASPSITIKIDFGSEPGSGAETAVAVSGAVPTPASAGGSAAASQSVGVVPTPFDSPAQGMAQAELGAPAPSPSLVPGGSAGSASDSSGLGDVPTPFSAGGLLPPGAGQPSGMIPTPFDSPAQGMAQAELGAPAPSPSLVPGGSASLASDSSGLGDVPTPFSAGGLLPPGAGQPSGMIPTPFDSPAQGMAQAELGAPAPSPSLVPGGSAGSASDSSGLGDVPTPFSAGGLLPQGAGQPTGTVPTPIDSVPGGSLTGDQAASPDFGSKGQAEETPPAPSDPAETSGRRGTKKRG
jgi:hypothetical protein